MITKEFHYPGFEMVECFCPEEFIRRWRPHQGEYLKNLFCSYVLHGRMEEYTLDGRLVSTTDGEQFINHDVTLEYPTDEKVFANTKWLCFSSHSPYTAELGNLVPSNTAAYSIDRRCYLKPVPNDEYIEGKVIIIRRGEFVNLPAIHR